MALARDLALRLAITAAVLWLIWKALERSDYDFDFSVTRPYLGLYLKGLLMTLGATAVAFPLGMILGLPVSLARLSRFLPLRHLGDMYVEFFRGTPFFVQLSLIYFGITPILGIDNKFLVGVAALGLFAAAYLGEIFRAGIESIDRGQVEAARSLGLTRGQALRHVVLPQALKRMIPPLTGELMALTKESSLLFVIGIVELTTVGRQVGSDTFSPLEAFTIVAAVYLSVTVPLSLLARWLERRLGTTQPLGRHL